MNPEDDNGKIQGYILTFKDRRKEEAYDFIESIESTKKRLPLYKWNIVEIEKQKVNILIRNPKNTAPVKESADEWCTIWKEPFFDLELEDSAINLLINYIPPESHKCNFGPIFDLQMHYLSLWTIIERFSFFRYGSRDSINERLREYMGNDKYFNLRAKSINICHKPIYSSDEGMRLPFDRSPIMYYHQLRNNVVHRGKALTSSSRDFELLKSAFIELLDIMKYVILETKKECETIKQQYDARTN